MFACIKKTFAPNVSIYFHKFPVCTVDAEAEWHLYKATVASAASKICDEPMRHSLRNNAKSNIITELRD